MANNISVIPSVKTESIVEYCPLKTKQHFSIDDLKLFLKHKRSIPASLAAEFSDHLNNCLSCWNTWNKVRWDASIDSLGLNELKLYLGDSFQQYVDSSWAIAAEWFKKNPITEKEIANFYKENKWYLYNLIVWYESGDRDHFENDFDKLIEQFSIHSVIDYGCGVGNDGLCMLQKGLKVNFIDYECPSIDFLRWRLNNRNLTTNILNVEKIQMLPKADMFWAIDVLEHMTNPLWVIDNLSQHTNVFVHRSQFGNDAGGRHPCHLNFDELRLGEALRRKGFKHIPWPELSVWVKHK